MFRRSSKSQKHVNEREKHGKARYPKTNFAIKSVFTLIIVTLLSAIYYPPILAAEDERIAILTTSEDWHYAMMASGLSIANGYPLLVTPKDALDEKVKKKIRGYNKVIILGNEDVIASEIEDELNELRIKVVPGYWGLEVERIGGEDIYETSALLVDKWTEVGGIIVTRGDIFPDTLAASQLSAVKRAPIIFTEKDEMPPFILDKIEDLKLDVTIVGGPAAVSEKVENSIKEKGMKVKRIGGANREETAAMVAENFIDEMKARGKVVDTVVFVDRVKGEQWSTLGVRSYVSNSAILFTGSMPEDNKDFLEAHPEITNALILVGKGSQSQGHPALEAYLKENKIKYAIDELDTVSLSLGIAEEVRGLSIPTNTGISIGQYAPNFQLTSIDGDEFSLSDLRGNVVVVYFMATWCPICIEETKRQTLVMSSYEDKGVVIITIDLWPGETEEQLREFKEKYGGDWFWALDTDDVSWKYRILYLGSTFIVDRKGIITYKDDRSTYFTTYVTEIEKVM